MPSFRKQKKAYLSVGLEVDFREHFVQLRGLFEMVATGVFPIPGVTIESADQWIAQIEQEVRETIPDFNVIDEIEYVAQLIENYYASNDEGPVMW